MPGTLDLGREFDDLDKPWERQSWENDLWYGRFVEYLDLGPARTVQWVATGRRNAYPIKSHWYAAAATNRWKERAEAHDAMMGIGKHPKPQDPPSMKRKPSRHNAATEEASA